MSAFTVEVQIGGVLGGLVRQVALEPGTDAGRYHTVVDGRSVAIDVCQPLPGVLSLLIDGRVYRCVLTTTAEERAVAIAGRTYSIAVTDPRSLRAQQKRADTGNGATQVKASMPGRVARVLVAAGDMVVAQQGIVVIEAMKMQNELKAARDGRIAEVRVAAGDTVTSGQILAVLE